MRPAVQSAEVAEEDEDDRPVGPEVTQPVLDAVGVGQGHRLEACEIHTPRLPECARAQKWNTSGESSNAGPVLAPA